MQDEELATYLEKVHAIYSGEVSEIKQSTIDPDSKINFLGKELELMADFRLGELKKSQTIKTLQDIQAEMVLEKEKLDAQLIEKNISTVHYADQVNANILKFLNESKKNLGEEAYIKLFGMASDTIFQIVDPKILAQYHQD
ncbi:hypothetical protein [Halodesulfovibrio marinisediminis]|uniref:Uncharacterized protein n=1 Tax=Halodesulfovibrio marinisediminis DSM 17456 TaxID=1121457 RepID=A0A1N6ECX0_9BACT|nr:hypothetical protein [Halodesulfovibrio marinisediminis]SIN80879.1 hypothetical protein SAMN02745161_0901 [Halodesulfovibrio marinisediminis DSM 17456]